MHESFLFDSGHSDEANGVDTLFSKYLLGRTAGLHRFSRYSGSMTHLADFLLSDPIIRNLTITTAGGGITDAMFYKILVTQFPLPIFSQARQCGFQKGLFLQERLGTAIRIRLMEIVNSDQAFGEVLFLMCASGCCLVVDPRDPSSTTEIQLLGVMRAGQPLGSFAAEKIGMNDWCCPHCQGVAICTFKYATISQWIRNMYADPEQRQHLQWYEDNFEELTAEKLDKISDILDSGVMQKLKAELERRGKPLSKWDIIFGINLDGAELLKYLSAWPLLVKCFCFPPKFRYIYIFMYVYIYVYAALEYAY